MEASPKLPDSPYRHSFAEQRGFLFVLREKLAREDNVIWFFTIGDRRCAFVEQLLPGAVLRSIKAAETAEYHRPYIDLGEEGRPLLSWPGKFSRQRTNRRRESLADYASGSRKVRSERFISTPNPALSIEARRASSAAGEGTRGKSQSLGYIFAERERCSNWNGHRGSLSHPARHLKHP
jgi:hypothetical protein